MQENMQEEEKQELEQMLAPEPPEPEKTEAELKDEFVEKYKSLVLECGFDFFIQPPIPIRVNFTRPVKTEDKPNQN